MSDGFFHDSDRGSLKIVKDIAGTKSAWERSGKRSS